MTTICFIIIITLTGANNVPCYRPIQGWRSRIPSVSGRRPIVFSRDQGYVDLPVTIPCGQCIGCRLDKSRQWAIRCVHEAKQNVLNSFITLTYNDEHLPEDNSLSKETLQKFFKRLRKEIDNEYPGRKIRYFACGEYGTQGQRPHYHVILFGHDFDDKQFISQNGGHKLYTSDKLANIWGFGFVTIGAVNFDSAAYTARYCLKKVTGEKSEEHYAGREPEFSLMSTGREKGSGIGGKYFAKHISDFESGDGRILFNGKLLKPARYYEQIYERHIGDYDGYKGGRKEISKKVAYDNTPDRLAVKERLQEYKISQMKINKGSL